MEKSGAITEDNRERIHEEIVGEVGQMLKSILRPEFLNRVDEVVVFKSLSKSHIREIVRLQFQHVINLLAEHDIGAELSSEAENYLADKGYDPAFGARPIKRLLQKEVTNPLASQFLEGKFQKGDVVSIGVVENSLDFNIKSS